MNEKIIKEVQVLVQVIEKINTHIVIVAAVVVVVVVIVEKVEQEVIIKVALIKIILIQVILNILKEVNLKRKNIINKEILYQNQEETVRLNQEVEDKKEDIIAKQNIKDSIIMKIRLLGIKLKKIKKKGGIVDSYL